MRKLLCLMWLWLCAESPSSRINAEKLRETLNVAHALKVKISKAMHVLNDQLQLVETFESKVQGLEGVYEGDCAHFVSNLSDVVLVEEQICKEFRALLSKGQTH